MRSEKNRLQTQRLVYTHDHSKNLNSINFEEFV
jgi:hypothetical protein